jgi:glycine oxidase
MSSDVIIIGGGVIGCSIAWRLSQAGLSVSLIEKGRIGCEASRAAAGMLSPQGESQSPGPFFDLCLRSRALYRDFTQELFDVSGVDAEYKDEGTLAVVFDHENLEDRTAWARWQLDAGLPLEYVSATELRKLEPAVAKSAATAIFLPQEHQIENRRLMDALEIAIRHAGVAVLEGTEVISITREADRVTGVETTKGRIDGGTVIVAAGTWSSALLQPLGLNANVVPARGQMLAVKSDVCPITRVLHSHSAYVVPRRDGRILIGATVEHAGFRKAVTIGAVNSLLNAALELVPVLADSEIIETWCGLRPDTADHLPILGFGGPENLLLATGHYRNGILLAPVTATLLTRTLTDNREPAELRDFSVERFRREIAHAR